MLIKEQILEGFVLYTSKDDILYHKFDFKQKLGILTRHQTIKIHRSTIK
jgi:hypothetical protein